MIRLLKNQVNLLLLLMSLNMSFLSMFRGQVTIKVTKLCLRLSKRQTRRKINNAIARTRGPCKQGKEMKTLTTLWNSPVAGQSRSPGHDPVVVCLVHLALAQPARHPGSVKWVQSHPTSGLSAECPGCGCHRPGASGSLAVRRRNLSSSCLAPL